MLSISLCIVFHTAQNIGAATKTGHDGEFFTKYMQITNDVHKGKKILSRKVHLISQNIEISLGKI